MHRSTKLVLFIATLAVTVVCHAPARAGDGDIVPGKVTSKVTIPFTATVMHPGTMENVTIAGDLLVKTTV